MASVGAASSLTIVPWPWLSLMVAPVAPDRLTKKVSSSSKVVSPQTLTVIVLVASPAAKVSESRAGLVVDARRRRPLAVGAAVSGRPVDVRRGSVAPVL